MCQRHQVNADRWNKVTCDSTGRILQSLNNFPPFRQAAKHASIETLQQTYLNSWKRCKNSSLSVAFFKDEIHRIGTIDSPECSPLQISTFSHTEWKPSSLREFINVGTVGAWTQLWNFRGPRTSSLATPASHLRNKGAPHIRTRKYLQHQCVMKLMKFF